MQNIYIGSTYYRNSPRTTIVTKKGYIWWEFSSYNVCHQTDSQSARLGHAKQLFWVQQLIKTVCTNHPK